MQSATLTVFTVADVSVFGSCGVMAFSLCRAPAPPHVNPKDRTRHCAPSKLAHERVIGREFGRASFGDRPMSVTGQKQTSDAVFAMSALLLKADIRSPRDQVR